MYIALEGLKGAGKSTVFNTVFSELARLGYAPHRLQPTSGRNLNLWDALHAKSGAWWPNWMIKRLYANRSNEAASKTPKRGLVLGERSVLTSYVSHWDAVNPLAGLERIDALERHIPLPNHVIFLSIPVELALERINSRPQRKYGIKDQTESSLKEADAIYRHLSKAGHQYGLGQIQWHWIDATQPTYEVTQQVVSTIKGLELPLPQPRPNTAHLQAQACQ